jgi:hypothetical protein
MELTHRLWDFQEPESDFTPEREIGDSSTVQRHIFTPPFLQGYGKETYPLLETGKTINNIEVGCSLCYERARPRQGLHLGVTVFFDFNDMLKLGSN